MHPANFGRLCSKGAALGETLGLEGRLLHPMVRPRRHARAGRLAERARPRRRRFRAASSRAHGPDAVAFYLSGQLLTEDYYVANKLMKGFIGSANVDTNSRLCMASSVAGHRRAFGADTVPGVYADLDEADLIVLVGSNAAWCHPVLFQRMMANKRERGARLVVIDPRRTATAEERRSVSPDRARHRHRAVLRAAGASRRDGRARRCLYRRPHRAALRRRSRGRARSRPTWRRPPRRPGSTRADVVAFFGWFRATPRIVTCYSQGVNQSAQGTDKVNAIINCHLATGRIGKPGMGPFSLTGQPNAMGGREVGGLANQLAAHMGFSPAEIDRVRRFWKAPRMATREGLKAVEMFEAIEAGRIKALWVMATNPAVSLPRAGAMRDALRQPRAVRRLRERARPTTRSRPARTCCLPAAAWGEKDGTVTNSERRITRQRAFLPPPGEAQARLVDRRRGGAAHGLRRRRSRIGRPPTSFASMRRCPASRTKGTRDFDIGGLAAHLRRRLSRRSSRPNGRCARETRAGSAASSPTAASSRPTARRASSRPSRRPCARRRRDAFPFRLNTGRVRDQWHTMTRSGMSPRLALHCPEPFVEVHPDDARARGLVDGGFARVTTRHGEAVLKVVVSDGQQPGSLFVPIHWSDVTASIGARRRSGRARDRSAFGPARGQGDAGRDRAGRLRVARLCADARRRSRCRPAPGGRASRSRAGSAICWRPMTPRRDLAADRPRLCWASGVELVEFAEYIDVPRGLYRVAAFVAGPARRLPVHRAGRGGAAMGRRQGDVRGRRRSRPPQRRMVLSGESADGLPDAGPVICSCFGVGLNVIRGALRSGAAANVEEIGKALRAGTNCGSCLPELKRIVQGSVT